MIKINWNPIYFFSTTNENHVFGRNGILWNNTIGKIVSLVEKIIKPPKAAESLQSKITPLSGDKALVEKIIKPPKATAPQPEVIPPARDKGLVEKMNAVGAFIYTNGEKRSGSGFLTSMQDYKNEKDANEGIPKDIRVTLIIDPDKKPLVGAMPQKKLGSVKELLDQKMENNTSEERLQVLNCLRQKLLEKLRDQIEQKFIFDRSIVITDALPWDNPSIALQFHGNTIKIIGTSYFQVHLVSETSQSQNLAFVRASIHVDIPMFNFGEARCRVEIEKASTKLEDILPATDKTKKVFQEKRK